MIKPTKTSVCVTFVAAMLNVAQVDPRLLMELKVLNDCMQFIEVNLE